MIYLTVSSLLCMKPKASTFIAVHWTLLFAILNSSWSYHTRLALSISTPVLGFSVSFYRKGSISWPFWWGIPYRKYYNVKRIENPAYVNVKETKRPNSNGNNKGNGYDKGKGKGKSKGKGEGANKDEDKDDNQDKVNDKVEIIIIK